MSEGVTVSEGVPVHCKVHIIQCSSNEDLKPSILPLPSISASVEGGAAMASHSFSVASRKTHILNEIRRDRTVMDPWMS